MSTNNQYILAGEGALWVQPDGPNTKPVFLGCHENGDLDEPLGDIKLKFCPDPGEVNSWQVVTSIQSAPGPIKTAIKTKLQRVQDYLEALGNCPGALYLLHSCGKRNIFGTWDRAWIIKQFRASGRKTSKTTAAEPEAQDVSEMSVDVQAEKMLREFAINVVRQDTAETEDAKAINYLDRARCQGSCGTVIKKGDMAYVGTGVLAGSPVNTANLLETLDAGVNWATTPSNPFTAGIVIGAVAVFQYDKSTNRILVAPGTAGAGAMRIAISDDGGHTWTLVTVGAVTGQFAPYAKSLFAPDASHIWLGTNDGYIYFSEDGGATWVAQTAGDLTTGDINVIEFNGDYGYASGETAAILKSIDGGDIWSLVTPPTGVTADSHALKVHDKYRAWVGFDDSTLWYTADAGTNWYQRTFPDNGTTNGIPGMAWYDDYVGFMLYNPTANTAYLRMTINGGYTWETVDVPPNAGLVDIVVVSPTLFFMVGKAYGGSAMILKGYGGS